MPAQKKSKKPHSRHRTTRSRAVRIATMGDVAVGVPVSKPTTEVITEKTYVTTEPEVVIRKPATLAQALAEPAVVVVKPKSRVRKQVVERVRRSA